MWPPPPLAFKIHAHLPVSPSFVSHSVASFPCQILLKILNESITTVCDVVRLAGVCTAFRRMLRQAPLRVRLPNSPGRPVSLKNARGAVACLRHRTPGAPCSTLQGLVQRPAHAWLTSYTVPATFAHGSCYCSATVPAVQG